MKKLIEKAEVLMEAMPYIRQFYGKTFVIKYGGNAMVAEDLKESFARDVVLMKYIGINPVIVHGGGPQISKTMERMGLKPKFVSGYRVTDTETMDIVEMVLGGKVNKEIVNLINANGGRAVGLTGKDGGLILAKKKLMKKNSPETGAPEILDLGLIGEVERVDAKILEALDAGGFIPVIAPVGVGAQGETYNINADLVAGSIAAALSASKLILMTDTEGILDGKGKLITALTKKKVEKLIKDDVITGGMLPKVAACFDALGGKVGKVHIIDGRVPHALLLEIFTKEGIGTEIAM
ncbi:MAG: acetylglutamate kinase [Nitrospirae bacterium]|nr:acetylglutamate kinase [Nitrospirota bacterium]